MAEQLITPINGGGSIPTPSLHFERCTLKEVSSFVKKHHYSHTHPGGIDFAFKLLWGGILAGACLIGWMAGQPKAVPVPGHQPSEFRELARLVLLDEVPKNSETRFIGWCLRWMQKNTSVFALVSFADPVYGHSGTIYKASNWTYLGLQKGKLPDRIIVDGEEIHPRMAFDKFGTASPNGIRLAGHDVQLKPREPKHKFIYHLRGKNENLGFNRQLQT